MFQPGSSAELASVADDSSLLFWDTRSGIAPVLKMAEAHGQSDLHVVDWSALRPELVATGVLGSPPHHKPFSDWQKSGRMRAASSHRRSPSSCKPRCICFGARDF